MKREPTVGEQFVKLCEKLGRSGISIFHDTPNLKGRKRRLAEKRDEMIISASGADLEDMARCLVERYPTVFFLIRETEDKSALDVLRERQEELQGEVIRDET